MDVKLQNSYVEVAVENFVAVVKQNLLFQAQINVYEQEIKEIPVLHNQIEMLRNACVELEKKSEEARYSKSSEALKAEKDRIQIALNDYMRSEASLKLQMQDLLEELENVNKYVLKLEEIVPASKLKKLKSVEEKTEKTIEETPEEEINSAGGTF